MKWTRPDAYHVESDCGRYTVARVRVNGDDTYIAWLRKPATELAASAPMNGSATDVMRAEAIAAMKAACERHAQPT